MKKYLLFLFGLMLFIPFMVDAHRIENVPFNAIVSNENGAEIYKWVENKEEGTDEKEIITTLEYNKEITITYDDGEYYVSEYEGYIKRNDFKLNPEEYKTTDETKLGDVFNSLLNKKATIRKGPGVYYDEVTTIPAGKKVNLKTLLYYQYGNFDETVWAYVEYNGNKGYINTNECDATYTELSTIMVTTSYKLSSSVTIPKNTVLKNGVYSLAMPGEYYVTYKGASKKLSTLQFVQKRETRQFKLLENQKVYKDLKYITDSNHSSSDVVTTLKKGTTFTSSYYGGEYSFSVIYYKNGNTEGWIQVEDIKTDLTRDQYYNRFTYNIEYCKLNSNGNCEGTPDQEEPQEPSVIAPGQDDTGTGEVVNGTGDIEEEKPTDTTDVYTPTTEKTTTVLFGVVGILALVIAVLVVVLISRKKKGTI